jgi:hypothetical protein
LCYYKLPVNYFSDFLAFISQLLWITACYPELIQSF